MKKGFTLIELLAVIVILAIIALIATPIILGIINDARKESNERSVELYASAVRNAIAAYQLTETSAPKSFSNLDIQYDGNVVCATEELYEDGSFYIADCTVNGDAVEYTYGTKQVTQAYNPQYYYFGYDWDGIVGETLAPENPTTVPPTERLTYIGYDVINGVVSTAYACFVRNGNEYCLKGYDTEAFATNNTVLEDAFKDIENACSFDGDYFFCEAGVLRASTGSNGEVYAAGDEADCGVFSDGYFQCYEY